MKIIYSLGENVFLIFTYVFSQLFIVLRARELLFFFPKETNGKITTKNSNKRKNEKVSGNV